MEGIKKGLESAGINYDKAIGSIESRMIPQIEKISSLGIMENINIKNAPKKARLNLKENLKDK